MSERLTHLVHHQRLDLPLQDLHAGGGDHRANVGHHNLAEDVADEPVVPLEAGRRRVLHGKAVVVVWAEEAGKALAPRWPNGLTKYRSIDIL